MSEAEKFVPLMKLLMKSIGEMARGFYGKYGKESLSLLADVSGNGGSDWGMIMKQMAPVKNLKEAGEILNMMSPMIGMQSELLEASEQAIRMKVPKCPYNLEGTSKELCEAMMSTDRNLLRAWIGEEVDTTVYKTVAAGDPFCDFMHSKKAK